MSDCENSEIDDAFNLFVQGAKTLSAGSYLDNNSLCKKGLAIIRRETQALDAAGGRDPLLRLLDDPDDYVRTVAAAGLWQSYTDRARQVIEDVQRSRNTEAGMLALKILMFHGRYNLDTRVFMRTKMASTDGRMIPPSGCALSAANCRATSRGSPRPLRSSRVVDAARSEVATTPQDEAPSIAVRRAAAAGITAAAT